MIKSELVQIIANRNPHLFQRDVENIVNAILDEISEAIDLLIRSGRTIDAIGLDGWRIDVGYPEDREEAERRLQEARGEEVEAEATS